MPQPTPIDPTEAEFDPAESPIAWFGELLLSIDRGDYRRAAESQRQLARLGWSVSRRQPGRSGRQEVGR
jgi:hypothetical protein